MQQLDHNIICEQQICNLLSKKTEGLTDHAWLSFVLKHQGWCHWRNLNRAIYKCLSKSHEDYRKNQMIKSHWAVFILSKSFSTIVCSCWWIMVYYHTYSLLSCFNCNAFWDAFFSYPGDTLTAPITIILWHQFQSGFLIVMNGWMNEWIICAINS